MKTGHEWLLVDRPSSKLHDRWQWNCVIRDFTVVKDCSRKYQPVYLLCVKRTSDCFNVSCLMNHSGWHSKLYSVQQHAELYLSWRLPFIPAIVRNRLPQQHITLSHLCQHSVQTPNYAALFVLQTAVLFYRAKHLPQINGVILLLLGDSKVVRKFVG